MRRFRHVHSESDGREGSTAQRMGCDFPSPKGLQNTIEDVKIIVNFRTNLNRQWRWFEEVGLVFCIPRMYALEFYRGITSTQRTKQTRVLTLRIGNLEDVLVHENY